MTVQPSSFEITAISSTTPADVFDAIGKLHQQQLEVGLLASLGTRFLTSFYRRLVRHSGAFLFAAHADGKVIGFVAGVENVRRFYNFYMWRYGLATAVALLPQLSRLAIFANVASLLKHLSGRNRSEPQAELLSFAVDAAATRRGVGRALF